MAAIGLKPDHSVLESLLSAISESHLVGDCHAPGTVLNANCDALSVAVEV